MKIKIRPEDTSGLRENGWFQTDGWLAEVRDDGRADPPGDAHAGPDGVQRPLARSRVGPRLMPSPRPAPALRPPPAPR